MKKEKIDWGDYIIDYSYLSRYYESNNRIQWIVLIVIIILVISAGI